MTLSDFLDLDEPAEPITKKNLKGVLNNLVCCTHLMMMVEPVVVVAVVHSKLFDVLPIFVVAILLDYKNNKLNS